MVEGKLTCWKDKDQNWNWQVSRGGLGDSQKLQRDLEYGEYRGLDEIGFSVLLPLTQKPTCVHFLSR